MDVQAVADGIAAFRQGSPRTANPFDPSADDWMCWRDGWEQAKAVADHIADGTAEACYGKAMKARREQTA